MYEYRPIRIYSVFHLNSSSTSRLQSRKSRVECNNSTLGLPQPQGFADTLPHLSPLVLVVDVVENTIRRDIFRFKKYVEVFTACTMIANLNVSRIVRLWL